MKTKFLISALVATVIGSQAMAANQVMLINASEDQKPMTIVYKIAHKNPGQATVYSESIKTTVTNQKTIPVELDGYILAGVVPTVINGHRLPDFQFDVPDQCSMATDADHPSGSLTFTVDKHKATCATKGGIIR